MTLAGRTPAVTRAAAQVAVGLGLLAGSYVGLRSERLQRADVRLGEAVRWAGCPALDRVVVATTDLGSLYAAAGCAAALAAAGRRRAAVDVLGVGLTAWQVAQRNKRRVLRRRPYEAEGVRRLIRRPSGSSFPSGHAAVGAAMFAVLAHHARGRPYRRRVFGTLSAYVPLTRVYVGVHYPTDVLGGAGLGLALAGLWRGPVAAGAQRLAARLRTVARAR